MNEHVIKKNKASATQPQATQASSPLLNQSSLTSETSGSVGSNSNISKESGGIQPKKIRRSLNWQNITVEAPSRGNGMSLPGGIQRQPEEPEAVSGEPVSADDKENIAQIREDAKCTKKQAEELYKNFRERVSQLTPEIKDKLRTLFRFMRAYSKLPEEINRLLPEHNSERGRTEAKITEIFDEFNILANEGVGNVRSLSVLRQIVGLEDFLNYNRLYFEFKNKKLSYQRQEQEQDTQNKPQSEALENPVNETQKSNNPMDILKTYGYQWEMARDVLAYGEEASMTQMETLVDFRSEVVSAVLQNIMAEQI
jgi:hypothetical protein